MTSKEQLKNGILTYVDREVIPHLPTAGKWGMGTVIILATSNYEQIYESLLENTIIKSLGVFDESGSVDTDRLAIALKKSAEKYGKLVISVPVIGTMSFSAQDVDKLYAYINGGA